MHMGRTVAEAPIFVKTSLPKKSQNKNRARESALVHFTSEEA